MVLGRRPVGPHAGHEGAAVDVVVVMVVVAAGRLLRLGRVCVGAALPSLLVVVAVKGAARPAPSAWDLQALRWPASSPYTTLYC